MSRNVIVAQSGGPSPVVNNSLRGIIDTCKMFPRIFGNIYAGWQGIEGVLMEDLLDISAQTDEEIALLRTTPAAGSIGTSRYKLKDQQQKDFNRIIEIFKAHNIGYFFYIGGNDSQLTTMKIGELAEERGLDLVAVGIPKSIDNDMGDTHFRLIDHTPGYGSVARYWANIIQNANEENMGSAPADPVLVLQAMGSKTGFIPAASRLADPDREMPLQIYMTESKVTLEELGDNVNRQLAKDGRCILVISEGFSAGIINETGRMSVFQTVVDFLNDMGIRTRGSARGQNMGTDQRSTMIYASTVDLDEAYKIGQKGVDIAINEGNGWMPTLIRDYGFIYNVRYDKVLIKKIAHLERHFPEHWIADNRIDVTEEFIKYARPLIGDDWVSVPLVNGRQRFTRFNKIFADRKLPAYTPEAYYD
jgi:ATP-dependent phosphofructokinase / diphosphate-dependent phosphofructokinase